MWSGVISLIDIQDSCVCTPHGTYTRTMESDSRSMVQWISISFYSQNFTVSFLEYCNEFIYDLCTFVFVLDCSGDSTCCSLWATISGCDVHQPSCSLSHSQARAIANSRPFLNLSISFEETREGARSRKRFTNTDITIAKTTSVGIFFLSWGIVIQRWRSLRRSSPHPLIICESPRTWFSNSLWVSTTRCTRVYKKPSSLHVSSPRIA